MRRILLALYFLAFAGMLQAQELQAIPALTGRVTDLTATLSADQRGQLEARLAAFEKSKGAQIAVLLVATVKPETVEQYALRVVEAWKLGRKGVDDGALLLIAKEDRKLRFEVGYGLEGALNDATARRIISETITPRFKQGDFFGGIDSGIDAAIRVIDGESLPSPKETSRKSGLSFGSLWDNLETLLFGGFVLVFIIGGVLRSIFGRFLGAGVVGVFAGLIAAFLLSSLLIAGIVGVLAFIFALLVGQSAGGSGGWSSGNSSWGGGGSSGGFSGGGGSFGGGGASGDW